MFKWPVLDSLHVDITNIESTSTRKIYSAFTSSIWPDRIGNISDFERLEILKVCMDNLQFCKGTFIRY